MTAQVDEILIFDGKETSMTFCPPLPDSHPGIIKLDCKDIKEVGSLIGSTACWRGYTGTWEIKNGQLYLIDIMGRYQITEKNPIFADWVSGIIRVPQGELLHCDRTGSRTYEQEIHVKIEKGKVVGSTFADNQQASS